MRPNGFAKHGSGRRDDKLATGAEPSYIEFHGVAGSSQDCQDAVVRLLHCGVDLVRARILTHKNSHCLLLKTVYGDLIAIKSGFASGYGGAGPTALSFVLTMLFTHGVSIDEIDVDDELLERVDQSALSMADVELIDRAQGNIPNCWSEYIDRHDQDRAREGTLWQMIDPVMPLAIVDERLADLALKFRRDPDGALMTGYRRLEDIVRARAGLSDSGVKLFAKAFNGKEALLKWCSVDESEAIGRANLFTAVYMAFRNPRAHRQRHETVPLSEFLALNILFQFEREAVGG